MYKSSRRLFSWGLTLLIILFCSQVYAESSGKTWQVTLSGAFNAPGSYQVSPGETLHGLMLRTGGLTPNAYPLGAVMTREHLRQQAKQQRVNVLQDLQTILDNLRASDQTITDQPNLAAAYIQHLARRFQQTNLLGRMVIEADPTVLQVRTELDTLLQDGDVIHMPLRANTLQVMGEVSSSGSFPFVSGKNADDYIDTAGGMTDQADDDRVFAVLPNGTTQALEISYWNYTPIKLAPNSTIVVPRARSPFDDLIPMHDVQRLLIQAAILATASQN